MEREKGKGRIRRAKRAQKPERRKEGRGSQREREGKRESNKKRWNSSKTHSFPKERSTISLRKKSVQERTTISLRKIFRPGKKDYLLGENLG